MNNIIKSKNGFTLVELVIVIVIVGILSVISVPIYRGYVDKAMMTEGKVLIGAIGKAELAYHVEHGYFAETDGSDQERLSAIDIDARGNKYFKSFYIESGNWGVDDNGENIDYVDIYVYGHNNAKSWTLAATQESEGALYGWGDNGEIVDENEREHYPE